MSIPDYQTVMRPILVTLSDGAVHRARAIKESMADHFNLSDSERTQLLPSGRARTMDSRVGWALTYLFQAGLTERPARGSVRITEAGQAFLSRHPERITTRDLQEIDAFRDFQNRGDGRSGSVAEAPLGDSAIIESTATPDELLNQAEAANRATVAAELLGKLQSVRPAEFELIVMKLLEAMGYGNSGSVEVTSASGDAGVDGIISQDPLGLDRIYVQAKRYADHRVIHRPTIQEFAGALQYRQGDRGVFITTSTYSAGAIEAAERINARIELIGGKRRAELLVKHRVGVQPEQTVVLYRVDEDFFETL